MSLGLYFFDNLVLFFMLPIMVDERFLCELVFLIITNEHAF